jgi:hypothetical protein
MLKFNQTKSSFLVNLSRLLFAELIAFELANELKILHLPLTFTWLGLILTSGSIWLSLELFSLYSRHNCGQSLSGLAMLAAAVVVYFDALGDIFFFYAKIGRYDQIAHFLGGAASALLFFSAIQILSDCRKLSLGVIGVSFFTMTSAVFLGTLYELEEYLEDIFTGSHRLGDAFDTANDLFLDFVGAILIAAICAFYVYRRNRPAN